MFFKKKILIILFFYYLFTIGNVLAEKKQDDISKMNTKEEIKRCKEDEAIINDNKEITNSIDKEETSIPLKNIIIDKNKGVPSVCLKKTKDDNKKFVYKFINFLELKKAKRFRYKFINYLELKKAKSNLKVHINELLIANNVSSNTIEYVINHLKYLKIKNKNKENVNRKMIDFIEMHNISEHVKFGKFYNKMYKHTLSEIEDLFKVDSDIIVTIWGMETKFGSFVGDYDAFMALYSACMNANSIERLQYFEKNIIYLALLIDRGLLKKDTASLLDGGIGGCKFMPESFYNFAISLEKKKADIINNNKDVFTSIANYIHSFGWRYKEGILTEVTLPENFDYCMVGMNTVKKIKDWKKLGVRLHKNKIGAKYMKNDSTTASIILIDPDDFSKKESISNKRAFLVYDNYKVMMKYNQQLAYGLTAGLIFEGIK